MSKWEIKKDGETKCHGDSLESLPNDALLATLHCGGYKVYIDGKLYNVKKKGTRENK